MHTEALRRLSLRRLFRRRDLLGRGGAVENETELGPLGHDDILLPLPEAVDQPRARANGRAIDRARPAVGAPAHTRPRSRADPRSLRRGLPALAFALQRPFLI